MRVFREKPGRADRDHVPALQLGPVVDTAIPPLHQPSANRLPSALRNRSSLGSRIDILAGFFRPWLRIKPSRSELRQRRGVLPYRLVIKAILLRAPIPEYGDQGPTFP